MGFSARKKVEESFDRIIIVKKIFRYNKGVCKMNLYKKILEQSEKN